MAFPLGKLGQSSPTPEITESECDLLPHIDIDKVMCLNEKRSGSGRSVIASISRLESDCDEQLIVVVPFKTNVKLSQILLTVTSLEKCPSVMKLFINKPDLNFDDVSEIKPIQTIKIDPSQLAGHKEGGATKINLPIDKLKFQDVAFLTIFVESNIGEGEVSEINHLALIGIPKMTMKLQNWEPSG